MSPFLDERGRRLFAANEALSLGRGGVTAVAAASGLARSTINRGVAELKAARNEIGRGIRRCGAGRKRETARQPGLLAALEGFDSGKETLADIARSYNVSHSTISRL
jgi:hypothetical protein